jgi:hypothetical protein
MSFSLIIGIGNTGTQIVKLLSQSPKISNCKMYAIDSVAMSADMESVQNVKMIPVISDEKCGSGRSRERGAEMFKHHDSLGTFNELYNDASEALQPIFVITSTAGGTGSGITPELIKKIRSFDTTAESEERENKYRFIPVLVFPSLEDPDAYHMNTSDLMLDLQNAGIETYTVFRNKYGTANYSKINQDIVNSIELILGKLYGDTNVDSIDESDLDVILSVPGRFISCIVESEDPTKLKRLITESALHSYQPGWDPDDTKEGAIIYTAFDLCSPFAKDDFADVFSDIRARIKHYHDEYKNICEKDGKSSASFIIAGLPNVELKNINIDYDETNGIADGAKRSKRPGFLSKKKPIMEQKITKTDETVKSQKTGLKGIDDYDWK